MCVGVLLACMFVHHMHVRCPEVGRSLVPGVIDSCELPEKYWELNPSPLEEQQQVPLTPSAFLFLFCLKQFHVVQTSASPSLVLGVQVCTTAPVSVELD